MREVTRDVEDIKQQVVTSLSKKADYVLIERLREQTLKKVDQEYLHQQMVKSKKDAAHQFGKRTGNVSVYSKPDPQFGELI